MLGSIPAKSFFCRKDKMNCKKDYTIKTGNRKAEEKIWRETFYSNTGNYGIWADKIADCTVCKEESIGISIIDGDCDDMTDEEALSIFREYGWAFIPKPITIVCPKCVRKVKTIAELV